MVVGLLGNESPDSNRFILVTPKSENDVRLQVTLGNQNPTGLPVGAVRGSDSDTTLDANMQRKLAACYAEAECMIFHGIKHEDYFITDEVVQYVIENVIE